MIYKAAQIFTGTDILTGYAVSTNNGTISELIPVADIKPDETLTDLGNTMLAPALMDIQLYGAAGRLLSVYPDAVTVAAIADYCKAGGATQCMPTVATSTYETIFDCVDAIKTYWQQGGKHVMGLHVEGPWINPAKKGAHKEEWIFSPTMAQAKVLLDYGKGVIKIITLAPECCTPELVAFIQSYKVVVSAGHSNATYQQATAAFNNGIGTATHLYNAMSGLQHRAPGMVGAIFNHPTVLSSVVPDGHHVDFAAIQIAKKQMGPRLFAITDAVTTTSSGFYQHTLETDKYTSNGILSGSALTMHKCFTNFVQHCSINIEEALRMCSLYPASAMGLQQRHGCIASGYAAEFIVLKQQLELAQVICD